MESGLTPEPSGMRPDRRSGDSEDRIDIRRRLLYLLVRRQGQRLLPLPPAAERPGGVPLSRERSADQRSPPAELSSPEVVPAGDDSVIVLWKSSTGSYPYQTTHLYTQKFDGLGDGIWGETYMLIYDSGAITAWNTPELMPDGGGGAIYFWYDSPDLSTFNVWVQHIDSSGNMLFPMNGAQASTNSSDRLHMYPSATYHPVGDQTFVFWVEENGGQTQYGLYGQLFSSTGERLWTDSGLELVPIGSSQISFVRALSDGDGIYVGYFTGAYSTALRTLRIGYDGLTVWSPVTLSAASLGSKGS
ncbi:MAG: hypothetical protein KAT47_02630, partial [Candidatus Aegiribacteria sp.]|nr:hypothetical protein [Candidatus Aegiribacteria sp.]